MLLYSKHKAATDLGSDIMSYGSRGVSVVLDVRIVISCPNQHRPKPAMNHTIPSGADHPDREGLVAIIL